VQALREWRLARARADEVPAYVVFNDRTLAELASRAPRTLAELSTVPGIGPAKLERYGAELLARLAELAA
jgi:ATP-dependent DNA helicase RecQ